MSIADVATFGTGGSEPYAHALRSGGIGDLLYLRDARSGAVSTVTMDVSRWNARADDADLSLLARVRGPVLDIGCGPGRMVRAAHDLGMDALGIDVSAAAILLARDLGGSFLHGSVFDAVPNTGSWQTALLVDGNIGIGGDIPRLLARCVQLLSPEGEIVVEVDRRNDHEQRYLGEVVDALGRRSDSFPWAEIGRDRLLDLLPALDLRLVQHWSMGDRSFCRLTTTVAR